MITPLIFTDSTINSVRYKKSGYQSAPGKINIELSGYETGQAILARNNITFKNLATPIEVTDRYNKKTFGKDHLDLPNIHVYEYPDTNLQVFIDENENMQNDSTIEARFYIKHQNDTNDSVLQNELCKRMIANCLQKQMPDTKLNNNVYGFYTISTKTNNNETGHFRTLNEIILNPQFDSKDLENEKKKMIEELKNTDYTKNNLYLLYDKNDLKSTEECINEINEINVDKLKKYYKNIIDNSGAGYYITLNKNIMSSKEKSNLLRDLNINITTKFKKIDLNTNDNSFVLNNKSAIFIKDDSIDGIEFDYPYESKTLRDDIIALFTTFLIIFLSEPYIHDESNILNSEIQLNSKNPSLLCKYQNLKFTMIKPEFTNLTPQRALNIHKELLKMVNDTDFTVTLEDIKQFFKKRFKNEINIDYKTNDNNENLYQYGINIFSLYEILDTIQTSDIKNYINKFMIDQEPIVRYNLENK